MDIVKLVDVTRGPIIESSHGGVFAVVDEKGKTIMSGGNIDQVTYFRSAAKPMQAVPIIESGAVERFSLNQQDLAIFTASHSGEDEHRETVYTLLNKIGLNLSYLKCGTHLPLHRSTAKLLQEKGLKPDVLHCSCSGKHSAMLTLAQQKGWNIEGYYNIDHPVQQKILETVSQISGVDKADVVIGIDGCGVPVFGIPVYNMALAYARFVKPTDLDLLRQQACNKLSNAMVSYPQLVAGTGRFCNELMKITKGKIVAKDGNEGVFCLGIPAKGWGMAVKIEDGHVRALAPAVIGILEQLDVLTPEEIQALSKHRNTPIKNFRQEVIGEIRYSRIQ